MLNDVRSLRDKLLYPYKLEKDFEGGKITEEEFLILYSKHKPLSYSEIEKSLQVIEGSIKYIFQITDNYCPPVDDISRIWGSQQYYLPFNF